MANPDPPTSFGPSNGPDRPGDGARPAGVPAQPPSAQRSVGATSAGIGQPHEESAGEKIGRFFRRAMDRLSGDESEWRREETGRPSNPSRRSWTPVPPSLRIPPARSELERHADEHDRRLDEQRRTLGREDANFRPSAGYAEGGPARSSRRREEFRQSGRGELGGMRRVEPEERSQSGQAWRDDDWTHRLARERESWNEWDWRESAPGSAEHRWQREPLAARDVMTRNPRTVARGGTLRDAAVIMREENCGVVPVVDSAGRLQGILTDRDIVVRGITDDLRTSRVEDVMTDEVSAVTEDEPLTSVLDLMGRRQIRRVPVVDRNDRLLGIISMADIATRADYDEDLQDAFLRISSRRSFWSLFT